MRTCKVKEIFKKNQIRGMSEDVKKIPVFGSFNICHPLIKFVHPYLINKTSLAHQSVYKYGYCWVPTLLYLFICPRDS